MKGISSTLLALIFTVFSLFSLMIANRSSEGLPVGLRRGQANVSELGIQFALQRYLERARSARENNSQRKSSMRKSY